MPEGRVGMVLGLGGLLLLLAGVALPERVTSPAIHILAIGARYSHWHGWSTPSTSAPSSPSTGRAQNTTLGVADCVGPAEGGRRPCSQFWLPRRRSLEFEGGGLLLFYNWLPGRKGTVV